MIVTIYYFPTSIKSVFILVECNTSLSKHYVAQSITVVCMIGWIWEKKQVCLRSLAFRAYEISRRARIFPRIRIRQKVLKTFVELWICWKCSKFKRCRIQIWTSSHLYVSSVNGAKWWQLTAEAISIGSICSRLCGSCCGLLGCHQGPLDTGWTTWAQTESRSTRPSTRSTGSSLHSGRHRTHYRYIHSFISLTRQK